MMRDHGGNLDAARSQYGGDDWIDLSTGINRVPYPIPPLPTHAWESLPTAASMADLLAAAATAYHSDAPMVALAGAQAAIQLVPHLRKAGLARVLSPTYNEHGATLAQAGWRVEPVRELAGLAGADIAVVVNPNNPDGQTHDPQALLALRAQVGLLVVDESFADPVPHLSVARHVGDAGGAGLIVLRSFGKFYGLAGVRLGFALGDREVIREMAAKAGPWPVSGAAIAIGAQALRDTSWADTTTARLTAELPRIDALAQGAGWRHVGGAHLFRLYAAPAAAQSRDRLARHRIWSRIFPWSDHFIRLGLPGNEAEWQRLTLALKP